MRVFWKRSCYQWTERGLASPAARNDRRMISKMEQTYLERTHEGYLLTDEHNLMLNAFCDRNVDLADELAHARTQQFHDNFISFMRENYATDVPFSAHVAAE